MEPIKLSVSEQIDRALEGRKQRYIVFKLVQEGINISEAQFSNKKKFGSFTDEELKVLSRVLGKKITK